MKGFPLQYAVEPLTDGEAVAALRALDASSPDFTHDRADEILYRSVPAAVREAYRELAEERCSWWAHG